MQIKVKAHIRNNWTKKLSFFTYFSSSNTIEKRQKFYTTVKFTVRDDQITCKHKKHKFDRLLNAIVALFKQIQ